MGIARERQGVPRSPRTWLRREVIRRAKLGRKWEKRESRVAMTPRSRPKTFIDGGNIRLNIVPQTREKIQLICPTGKSVTFASSRDYKHVQSRLQKYFA
jgi:hypothetical protein